MYARHRRTRACLKDNRREAWLFRVRAITCLALVLLGLMVLAARFFFLQVMRHDEYAVRSQQNRVHLRRLPPARGMIYDRNGVLLAANVPAFRLDVVPERVKNMHAMLKQLRRIVPLSDTEMDDFLHSVQRHRSFQSVPLKLRLTEDEIDCFAVNRWRFPGVDVAPYLMRSYPQGQWFAHIVGYVGRIDQHELQQADPKRYDGTMQIGKTGIERYYESRLHGDPGYRLVEVNADQRVLRVLETHRPRTGENLYLSIDARLQKAALEAFAGRAGAAVAIDPRNGQVLAMVSVPAFDPNLFVNGISRSDYAALLRDPRKPLLPRALRGLYPPGSVVKPFIALGGLELGLRKPSDTVNSTGIFYIPGHSRGYRDDQRGGAGRVDLVGAIERSVNTYFYQLALDMGIDHLSHWMARFGFGQLSGIDLNGEARGVLPSRAWKRGQSNAPWYPGETVIAGIGQGYWAVTPLQLAHAIATLANRGLPHVPRLLMAVQHGVGAAVRPLSAPGARTSVVKNIKDWHTVLKGMLAAVYSKKGTAYGLADGFPLRIAGKTGTAERFSRTTKGYQSRHNRAELAKRHRALFEAFTPSEHARIAVAVVVEQGAWGRTDAAPVARRILDAWAREQDAVTHKAVAQTP